MLEKLINWFNEFLIKLGLSDQFIIYLKDFLLILGIALIAWISDIITRNILLSVIARVTVKTKTQFDDFLLQKKVFHRLAHLLPALIIFYIIELAFGESEIFVNFIQSGILIYIIIFILLILNGFVDALYDLYNSLPISKNRPIKGYIQIIKIVFYFIAGISVISVLFNQSPGRLLAGLGALAAVLLLVFKDTILGLVASIQLSANKMLKPGDWITMTKYEVDGIVIEISLHTVKVQNFDKTIVTIPTYSLVSEPFKNWCGMEEFGARRIRRAVNIDLKTIKQLDIQLIEKFRSDNYFTTFWQYLTDNIDENLLNKNYTNLGLFRIYFEKYLLHHSDIRADLLVMVRLLPSNEYGIPLEFTAFSKFTDGLLYEKLQSEITEHLIVTLKHFELDVYQYN